MSTKRSASRHSSVDRKVKIFLDDVREPHEVYFDGGTWLVCRDIEICKTWLNKGYVSHLSLDGDMGKIGNKDIPGGVELLDWMKAYNVWPEDLVVLVHSQNPVKANLMRQIIKARAEAHTREVDEKDIEAMDDIEDPSKESNK